MEPLSTTASVIAVGSVAVQLIDSVKKLRDFWCSVKDAPDNVRAIAADLEVLSYILAEINLEAQDQKASMKAALLRCIDGIKPLAAIVEDLEPGFKSKSPCTRKWSALKRVFRDEKIKTYQSSLESMKTSLILAQQSHYGFLSRRQLKVQQLQLNQNIRVKSDLHLQNSSRQNITFSTNLSSKQDHIRALSQEILHITGTIPKSMRPPGFEMNIEETFKNIFDALESETTGHDVGFADQQFSLPDKQMAAEPTLEKNNPQPRDWICHLTEERYDVLKSPFGTIYVRSTISKLKSRYFENEHQYEHETSFTICPAWWLVKVGFTYVPRFSLFSSTIQGWKYALSSFRSVPDNALIFDFCSTGNLSGVQALLARGEASVKDIDSTGKTALHFAAARHDVQICKYLISAGADKDVYEWNGLWTPLLAAADHNNEVIIDATDGIDTLRLFQDSIDFFDHHGGGWRTVVILLWNISISLTDGVSIDDAKGNSLIEWMLRLPASDVRENFRKEAWPILKAFLSVHDGEEVGDRLLTLINKFTHATRGLGKYSALQNFIYFAGATHDMNFALTLMLKKGANLHLVCDHFMFSDRSETPTSIALYSSFVFVKWRDSLLRSSVDLESFAEDEVQQSPLKDAGWNKDSLLALFRCDIRSDYTPARLVDCGDCSQSIIYIPVEPSWRGWLNRFKEKTDTKTRSNNEYSGAERDQSNSGIVEQKSPSLEVKKNFENQSRNEEKVADETKTECFGANFGGERRVICMRCYLQRQGYGPDIWSHIILKCRGYGSGIWSRDCPFTEESDFKSSDERDFNDYYLRGRAKQSQRGTKIVTNEHKN